MFATPTLTASSASSASNLNNARGFGLVTQVTHSPAKSSEKI
jgi:hypothetical protein